VTALELFRALLGPKELDEPEEGVLFELPEKPAVSCVPCCDWCGMQGPPIPADLGIGKRYRFGETWERRGEHPEELARLLEDREAFAGTEDLDDEEDDDADLE
jgi:hypothetical protein